MANASANFEGHENLENRLAESWPVREWCDCHVVLAVSGGPDSVALLRAVYSLKRAAGGSGDLHVAHLNHGMRGQAAIEDERWLESVCERMELTLIVERADVAAIAGEQGDGWEAAARSARYEFLLRVAERIGARFVATAHTADDQVETVLHRILRGTGIDGLAGIPRVRPLSASVALVRPMLRLTRVEVLDYLRAIGQDFCEDATNYDRQWTRNRLRNELLPQLRERYNRQVDAALTRLASQAAEVQQVIADAATAIARESVVADFTTIRVDCGKLKSLLTKWEGEAPAEPKLTEKKGSAGASPSQPLVLFGRSNAKPLILVREVFRIAWNQAGWPQQSMGFDQWQQLAELASRPDTRTVNFPGSVRARREGQMVVLSRTG